MNETIWLNDQWGFTENYSEAFAAGEACDTVEVRLPHTVKETPFHYFDDRIYQMVCGYRRLLFAPESWRGRHVLLNIGAAGHSAEVYVNGRKAAEHGCGYTAFCVDLSGFLEYGEKNLLVIRVDSREQQNIPPFGFVIDYMTYGGLYREVSLEIKEENYLEDVFECLKDAGVTCITYMPTRNTPAQLERLRPRRPRCAEVWRAARRLVATDAAGVLARLERRPAAHRLHHASFLVQQDEIDRHARGRFKEH